MVTFQLEQSQENLTSHAGLALFGATLAGSQLADKLNQIELPKAKQEPQISHKDVVVSYFGLLGLGQSAYEAIEPFRADETGFKLLLDVAAVPSCATLRQRLDQLAEIGRPIVIDVERRKFGPPQVPKGHSYPSVARFGAPGY